MKATRYGNLGQALTAAAGDKNQQAIAAACGVAQPSVSDWMNGFKRPRPHTLAVLADYLGAELGVLIRAGGYDPAAFRGSSAGKRIDGPEMVGCYQGFLALVKQARFDGSPTLAVMIADTALPHLRALARTDRSPLRREALKLASRFLFEKGRVLGEVWHARQLVAPLTEVIEQVRSIAEQLNDPEVDGLAHTLRAGLSYGVGSHRDSLRHHLQALKHLSDPEWRLDTVRAALISAGVTGDRSSFASLARETKRMLESSKTSADQAVFLLEGLARGQSFFSLETAIDRINTVSATFQTTLVAEGRGYVLRKIQIIRSRAHILERYESADSQTEQSLREGMELATTCGYHRYFEDLKAHLFRIAG